MKFLRMLMILVIGFAFSMVAIPRPQADASLNLTVNPRPTLLETPAPIAAQLAMPTGKFEPYAVMSSADDATSALTLYPVSLASGEVLEGIVPLEVGKYYIHALSPDGMTLAMMVYPGNMSPRNGTLHLLDLERWIDTVTPLVVNEWVGMITWNPAGTQLAMTSYTEPSASSQLAIYDLEQAEIITEIPLAIENPFFPTLIRYTPDGDALLMYGQTAQNYMFEAAYALRLNSETLATEWQAELAGVVHGQLEVMDEEDNIQRYFYWQPAVVLTPDARQMYIVHADSDALTTVNFEERRVSTTSPEQTRLHQLLAATASTVSAKSTDGTTKQAVLSADGTRLFVVGRTNRMEVHDTNNWESIQTPLNLQVIAVATGRILDTYETAASDLRLSPDADQLYLYGGWEANTRWTEIITADAFEPVHRIAHEQTFPVELRDHSTMLLASYSDFQATTIESRLTIIEPGSFEVVKQFTLTGYATWLYL